MNQEIWDNFEKIALAEGLITASDEDDKPKEKAKRNGLSDDAVRFLYNIEPDSIYNNKDMVQVAHPNIAVILPSYDAMNGVLENENQRHDIMTYVALKDPSGKLTNRYVIAQKELMDSLVKAAFLLDNKNETELMTLADHCAVSLDKKKDNFITKEAAGHLALLANPWVAGAAAIIGGIYYFAYGVPTAQSVYTNSKRVLEALQPLSNKPYANGIRTDISNLMQMASDLYSLKDELTSITSIDEVVDVAKQQQEQSKVENIKEKIKAYKTQLNKVLISIPDWVNKIKIATSTSKDNSTGFWGELKSKIKNVTDPFYNTDEEDLVEELYGKDAWLGLSNDRTGGLYEAIGNDLKAMDVALQSANSHIPQIQQSIQQGPFLAPEKQKEQPKEEQGYFINDDQAIFGNPFFVGK